MGDDYVNNSDVQDARSNDIQQLIDQSGQRY
jgi:hypothetical protein